MDSSKSHNLGISKETNEDGSVTISFAIAFDPAVRTEKAKAIPRGEERGDLPDDFAEEQDDVAEDEPAEPEAEDEAPKAVFTTALDSLLGEFGLSAEAQDAKPSRHGKTPLSACRAKDPRFCPYHGDEAIKDYLVGDIVREIAKSNPSFSVDDLKTVDVSVEKKGSGYAVSIRNSNPRDIVTSDAVLKAISDLRDTNGMTFADEVNNSNPNQSSWDASVRPVFNAPVERLREYVDDLVLEMSDNDMVRDAVEPNDVVRMLESVQEADEAQADHEADPGNVSKANAASQSFAKAMNQYETIRAVADYPLGVSVGGLRYLSDQAVQEARAKTSLYAAKKQEIDDLKKALWKNGSFTRGFAKANRFAEDYNSAVQKAGHWTATEYQSAENDFYNACAGFTQGEGYQLSYDDRKTVLPLLSNLQYRAGAYADATDKYLVAADKFKKDLYDYATSIDPQTNQPRFPKETVDSAFGPNPFQQTTINKTKTYTAPVDGSCDVSWSRLTELNGLPSSVGLNFSCHYNQLTSLEGAPSSVGLNFYGHHNQLTSLKGVPSSVGGEFNCENNQLTSLEGAPSSVGGDFFCKNNQLTSLKGAPSSVGGSVNFNGCNLTDEQIQAYKDYLKNPDPAHTDATGHYIENPA